MKLARGQIELLGDARPLEARDLRAWAVEWHSRSALEGDRRDLVWHPEEGPGAFRLFRTRQEARDYIEMRYGYLRKRPDLRRQPFGWFLARAVPVKVVRDGSGR